MYICSGSVELQMCENGIFFTSVKKTLICRVPRVFLGHMTRYHTYVLIISITLCIEEYRPWALLYVTGVIFPYLKISLPLNSCYRKISLELATFPLNWAPSLAIINILLVSRPLVYWCGWEVSNKGDFLTALL